MIMHFSVAGAVQKLKVFNKKMLRDFE